MIAFESFKPIEFTLPLACNASKPVAMFAAESLTAIEVTAELLLIEAKRATVTALTLSPFALEIKPSAVESLVTCEAEMVKGLLSDTEIAVTFELA